MSALGEFFYWVFNMSLVAALTGLIVLLVRRIRAIPRRIAVLLWIVPFLRMCFPLGLNSPYSLMSLISRVTTRTVTVYSVGDAASFSMMNVVMAANGYFPITYRVSLLEPIFRAAGLAWLIGAAAIIIALAALYFSTMREIRDAKRLEGNVYLSEKVQGAAVYGILRPRIVLPASYAGRDLRYILLHERAHIRRADNLARALAFVAAAVHWFNPFCWLFLRLFLADLELACDETAAAKLSADERRDYARALLGCAESRSLFASAFGGARIRTRIENLLSFRRMTVFSAIGFAAVLAAIAAVLVTNAG